jgi:FAD/FMN-containing dehydrogenase/Fe-S oxidoreductase
MLKRLPIQTQTTAEMRRFLLDLQVIGFDGDISTDEASRAVASTDNSVWQVTPQVVLFPKSHEGVVQVVKLISNEAHRSISITPRGGGTSTAGQSLSDSVVLDCKRYMHQVISYDSKAQQVHVECGAVLRQVNDELLKHRVMIGPTVATASRATIGGMIGNDSAGKGSCVYGKMSDCVVSHTTVIHGGETYSDDSTLVTKIKQACDTARPHLSKHWPTLPRFLSGYNLPMAWDGTKFDSNRIFCGAEGTLGVTTSAILQCVPIPTNQQLLFLCFDSFDTALRCGAELAKHSPTAIEAVDDMIMQIVRNDASWDLLSPLLEDAKDNTKAILFVEGSDSTALVDLANQYKPLLAKIINDEEEKTVAWDFRSRSVGLLSSLKGNKRPVPFVEDCAVPPERLADFVIDFKKILTKRNLRAGMFGHVDVGVMHIRPALNMQSETDRKLLRCVTEEVVELVHSYDGVLWGEHGKGFRSEFGLQIFGDEIWEQMCAIKTAFDPYNQFNPGKVAVPKGNHRLATVDSPTRGEQDAKSAQLPVLSRALSCDGNSECQSFSNTSKMCPTYRATDDPSQSPRGRADVLRAWLNKLGSDTNETNGSFWKRLLNAGNQNDFSHQVKEILDSCVACKACATDCPMQIDIPTMRAHFYALYFGRYIRPLRDIAFFNMERSLQIQRIFPLRLLASLVGICDVPKPTYKLARRLQTSSVKEILIKKPDVVLLQDSFTTFFRPAPFQALQTILQHLGKNVAVLSLRPNGKALHVRGALTKFNKIATDSIAWLTPLAQAGIPIVGIDPAATLLWRVEYPENDINVLLPQEWLVGLNLASITMRGSWRLFPHCIEHSMARPSSEQWKQIFESMGATLECMQTSCCGMGGLFGHQKEYKQASLDMYEIHWAIHEPLEQDSLTTGYSCKSQAERATQISLRHPLEVIASSISPTHLP